MAYDRYDTRDAPRGERSRWRDRDDDRYERGRGGGGRDERGFFERAGDEIASWFGDDEAERRRREDQRMEGREHGWSSTDRDWRRDEERGRFARRDYERDRERGRYGRDDEDSGFFGTRSYRGVSGEGGTARAMRRPERWSDRELGYSPNEHSRNDGFFAASGMGRDYRSDYRDFDRGSDRWGREGSRGAGFSGSDRSRDFDPHYHSWRQRQIDELDRDYDDYRRENQSRFESDFGSWRERRMQKRGLLGQIREHMEVVGRDDQHVGTIDRVAGDRLILTKSDPESGGVHHSLSCSDVDRVEGDRVILDCSADEAKQRWRDESRSRALFEREDQGEMGDRVLDRSFSGTYRE